MNDQKSLDFTETCRLGKKQGNWVEQWGFEAGGSVSVECYQNKLVILKA